MPRLKTERRRARPEPAGVSRPTRSKRRLLIWPLAAVIVVLALSQLLLPAIATKILRNRLEQDGTVLSVQVHAFPAVELLWQHADSVELRMLDYTVDLDKVTGLLEQALGVGKLNIAIGTLKTELLTLHQVTLTKQGSEMVGTAVVRVSDLQRALPIIRSVTPVSTSDGRLTLRGTANVLGLNASVDAAVEASDGKLVVAPSGLLGAFATVTVFSDPRIYVQDVTGHEVPGGVSVTVRAQAR
jgi:hypothetical protein